MVRGEDLLVGALNLGALNHGALADVGNWPLSAGTRARTLIEDGLEHLEPT